MGRNYMGYDSMKKGVEGGLFWTILIIIVGIVAVILLWLFLSGVSERVPDLFDQLMENFKQMIKGLLGPLGWLMGG